MSFNSRLRKNQLGYAAAATTAVATGSTVGTASANKVLMDRVARGTCLVAKTSMVVNTSSLTLTPKWQGSHDGTNWEDLFQPNSAANVATAAGTGSDVTTARSLVLPVVPYLYTRVVFVTGGATAHAANDTTAVSYHWLEEPFNN
jgi:hypothetical protein